MAFARKAGFTLIELLLAMGMIGTVLSVVIPNVRAMIAEGQLTRAEAELSVLKTAVTSYWRNNGAAYPLDIHGSLVNATPQVIAQVLQDPFSTDSVNQTYGYVSGTDSAFGPYFICYSRGPLGDTPVPTWDGTNKWVSYSGNGRVVSNAPVIKTP